MNRTNLHETKISLTANELRTHPRTKISIIGNGKTSATCAAGFAFSKILAQICLIMIDQPERARAEINDIQSGAADIDSGITYIGSSDIAESFCSDVCIISLESKISLESVDVLEPQVVEYLQQNVNILKKIIPEIVKSSPNIIFVINTYPYGIMTYATTKYSRLPKQRVIGLGTSIDTKEFIGNLAKRFDVAPSSCSASLIGIAHREYLFPVWSEVIIAGERLINSVPTLSQENNKNSLKKAFNQYHNQYQGQFITLTMAVIEVVQAILWDSKTVLTVTTSGKGLYGIKNNLSLLAFPCIIGQNGIHSIIIQQLKETEKKQLLDSQKVALNIWSKIKF